MRTLSLCFLVLFCTTLAAQPHLEGRLTINQKLGLLEADFTLSNLPPLAEYRILLNHGMNVHYFTADSGRQMAYDGYYGGRMRGEALEYVFLKGGRDTLRPLPPVFRIKYKGAYPVYSDTLNLFDFKGYIAFNGQTLRAAEQSKWYPVLYDAKADRLIDAYTYNITVTAPDSKTVFINGSKPQQKKTATFTSTQPRPLVLFAGNYDYTAAGGNYILNANINRQAAQGIFQELERIKAFHAKTLGLTYGENVYLIAHKAVKNYPPQASWGFAVFPTFAYANLNFQKLLDSTGHFSADDLAFFAHELSHYYFGSKMLSGPLQWFFLESTTEYLSLKAAEALAGADYYQTVLNRYVGFLKSSKYPPLASVTKPEVIDENYRYLYGPLILLAFEKEFGLPHTYKTLQGIVKRAGEEQPSLAMFRQAALEAGIKQDAYAAFAETYLQSDKALANVLDRVK